MAIKEIREYVMVYEPDKCRACGRLFSGVTLSAISPGCPYPDVVVQYDCSSIDKFTTFIGTPEQARETEGVSGLHVGDGRNNGEAVYLRRIYRQQGSCFEFENVLLKKEAVCAQERIDVLEDRRAHRS